MKLTLILMMAAVGGMAVQDKGNSPKKADKVDQDRLHQTAFGRFQGRPITLKNAARVKKIAEHDDYVWKIRFSRDGKRVAFVHWEGPVEIRDGRNFRLLRKFKTARGPIHFAFSANADVIGYCENDKVTRIHNLKTGKTTNLATGNPQPQMAFDFNGKIVATGGYGNAVKLWSVTNGKLLKTLDAGRKKGGLIPVFNPDEEVIAVGHRNSYTSLFDSSSGKKLHVLRKAMTQEIAFSPDGQTLACTYVDASFGLWNVADGKQKVLKPTTGKELYTVSWSPDGKLIATAGLRAKITLWDASKLKIVRELEAPRWVISIRFTPDGTRLLASGGAAGGKKKVLLYGVPGERKRAADKK